jgi:hypothetical protein
MRFQGTKTTRDDCYGDCLQTTIVDCGWTHNTLDVNSSKEIIQLKDIQQGMSIILFHMICRWFQRLPIGFVVMYQGKLWSREVKQIL